MAKKNRAAKSRHTQAKPEYKIDITLNVDGTVDVDMAPNDELQRTKDYIYQIAGDMIQNWDGIDAVIIEQLRNGLCPDFISVWFVACIELTNELNEKGIVFFDLSYPFQQDLMRKQMKQIIHRDLRVTSEIANN